MFELVRTRTNREFFGIPRFTPWFFLWKLNINFNDRLGEPPAYLDSTEVQRDVERIKTYYRAQGFRDVKVSSEITILKKHKVRVSFNIVESEPYKIQTITYDGMPEFEADSLILRNFFSESELTEKRLNDTTYTVGRQYSNTIITEEQQRIINFLKNNGYAAAQGDSVKAFVRQDPSQDHSLHALFLIYPGNKYKFGDVYLDLEDSKPPTNYNQIDTLTQNGKNIIIKKEQAAKTENAILLNQLRFLPGEIFSNQNYLQTVNDFQNIGMLSVQRFGLNEDAGLPDFSEPELPVAIKMNTLPKNSISMEVFGLQRFGLGVGSGVNYTNNNLFHNAERLEISVNGSFEFVSEAAIDRNELTNVEGQGSQFLNSLEGRIDYSVPRLNFPFAKWDNNRFFRNSRTRYSVAFSSSDQLNFDINSDILMSLRYEVRHDRTRNSFLDLLELDWLEANPTNFFINSLEDQFGEDEENPLELERILEDFRSQFSSIIRYTFRNVETDIIKRDRGEFEEYSISFGGNIPFLIDNFIVTPDSVESTIPGIFGISGTRLSYTQFFKTTLDYRRYYKAGDEATFAIRGFAGFVHPYGKNTTIPLNRRFFAGGSSDIRGYAPNNLGPGSIPPGDVTINGGEIKLAAFAEYRGILINDVFGADWIGALYTDAGNIWYGPRNDLSGTSNNTLEQGRFKIDEFYNQIAVSSGFGLRVDWQYVVMRFDFTRRVHDLQDGWFNNKNLFFTFGIGHSF